MNILIRIIEKIELHGCVVDFTPVDITKSHMDRFRGAPLIPHRCRSLWSTSTLYMYGALIMSAFAESHSLIQSSNVSAVCLQVKDHCASVPPLR